MFSSHKTSIKKYITSLLLFFVFLLCLTISGCNIKNPLSQSSKNTTDPSTSIQNTDFGSTILSLLTPEDGSKTLAEEDIQEAFSYFCKQAFLQEISFDSISLHYTLAYPEKFGLDNIKPSFGEAETEHREAISAENYLYLLSKFPYKSLTKQQKMTYQVFKESLEDSIAMADYQLYAEPLSKTIGIQAQLPVLLSEYTFYREQDVEDYLTLLTHLPAYFEQLAAFERQKAEAGLFMHKENALAILNQCDEITAMEKKKDKKNFLIISFEERLQELSKKTVISDKQSTEWIEKNKQTLKEYFYPAYQYLGYVFKDLLKSNENTCGLSYFPEGKEYYKKLVHHNTGSDRNIEELKRLINDRILLCASKISNVIESSKNSEDSSSKKQNTILNEQDNTDNQGNSMVENSVVEDAIEEADHYSLPFSDASNTISYLRTRIAEDFPMASQIACNILSVPESLTEYLSPAFYLTPPIDCNTENCIYINEPQIRDDLSFFTTLAHEGYPGHLYQNAMFQATNPDMLRMILSYPGYNEGWASYAEMYSYRLSGLSDYAVILQENNAILTLCMYAMADIHIHYDCYTEGGLKDYLKGFGITNEEGIHNIYLQILAEPANYLKYTIGCLEFFSLKEETQERLQDSFDLTSFHEAVLTAGPCSFSLLKEWIKQEL